MFFKKIVLSIILILCLSVVGGYFLSTKIPHDEASVVPNNELPSYTSREYDLQFSYPKKYFLAQEGKVSTSTYSIVLAEDTEEIREIYTASDIAIEGPISFSITIFEVPDENYTVKRFIEENPLSNDTLSDKTAYDIEVGGENGIRYHTKDIYENDTVVVLHSHHVYMFRVFYNTSTDVVLQDFDSLIRSVLFIPPSQVFDVPPEPIDF